MGVCGDLFQASVRLAMTGNFRGEPSSGRALSEATETNSPVRDLRRSGSSQTTKPLAIGTSAVITPMRIAQASLRKPRRLAGTGDSALFACSVWVIFDEYPSRRSDDDEN